VQVGSGDQLVGRREGDSAPGANGGTRGRWHSLYAAGQPTETGIGAATVRHRRRWRRRLWLTGIALLAVAGFVAYLLVPRWWFNDKAYVDHLGYGPYEGEMPAALHSQLAKVMPPLISFVEKERGHRFLSSPAVVFLPDKLFENELDSHIAFEQRHYVGGTTYDALGWVHNGDTFDRRTVDLHGSSVVALYGDWDGTIYLRGHDLTSLAKAQLVGLLTQSLDDQRYNLAALYGPDAEQDERTAYDALIAGDTRYVTLAYLRTRPIAERCAAVATLRLPVLDGCDASVATLRPKDPVTAEIRFPDDYGLRFVTRLRAAGGTTALDAAFAHPPRSTADIMSIPHYRLDRAFRVVPSPAHAGRLVDFGTLGAYTLSMVLAGADPRRVDTATTVVGWRGDSFSTYQHDGALCVTDTAVFDTAAQTKRYVAQARAASLDVRSRPRGAVTVTVCH
jgi:hypothetical protein